MSSRETAFKVRSLRRDPRVWLCVLPDGFYGRWIQVSGSARIVDLPEAMDGLVDYYRRISGEHADWGDYRRPCSVRLGCSCRSSWHQRGPIGKGDMRWGR